MERSKIIAAVCAVIAFALVLIAGKSCTDDAMEKKEQSQKQRTATSAATYNIIYPDEQAYAQDSEPVTYETNILGMTIVPTTTAVQYDIFGRPVTTTVETAADFYEDIVTAPIDEETVTDENGEAVTAPTTAAQPRIGGFDHGQYDDEGNPIPTLPSDFVLIIE
ncbi:MAG: hypothetical protein IKP78_06950 [Ruminococcus sp.]|nr:hypothetical protein [Ruminococcus sp.]